MPSGIFQFADFELDRNVYELRHNGHPLKLERIPLDLLFLLVDRRDQLVTREEILERIWGKGVFLDADNAINSAVRKIRRALGDNPDAPRFVVTVPTKGYRFVMPVIMMGSEIALTDHDSKVTSVDARQTQERRHLTVLICELTNSTTTAAQSDPEDWWENVTDYRSAVVHSIEHYGGHVGTYRGDCMMAYFGWPAAHDNDAERAARAGLAILDVIPKLNERSGTGFSLSFPMRLSARVGIDSGTVVVGAGAGNDAEVFGDVPNIAARVQSAAEPDTVLITAAAHRLISGLFIVENVRPRDLKAVPAPIELFRIVRPTGVRGRIRTARGLTPFVGREEELRLLLSRWERTREGEGQMVLVVGEAGIGKSRLVAEFHKRIRDTPHIWMESAGEQLFENTPFHAIIEMLSQWLEPRPSEAGRSPERSRRVNESAGSSFEDDCADRLERALDSVGIKVDEAAPLVADLLQLQVGARYQGVMFTPEEKRRRLLAVLTGWILGAVRMQPMVMVVEDLHWLDPSSLELQQLLAEQGAIAPLMLLYTARPEFRQPWPLRSHHTQITLNRLSTRDAQKMIEQVASRHVLARETLDAVTERTSGVPLFVEELTRAVLEGGDARPGARTIPETLHDSLMARLDRLGAAKEVAQLAAVIGPEFSYELLQLIAEIPEDELRTALTKLTDAELIYARGFPPEATYQFKHALIRDTAYDALLKSRRRELHRLVADTIDKRFAALREQAEVLAHHWTEAGETELAITQWSKAGKAAEARNAFSEARESYQLALSQLSLLPESPERDARELQLVQSLFSMLFVTRGVAAPETVAAVERAAMLAEKCGNLGQLIGSIHERGTQAFYAGELGRAGALADQELELARREGSSTMLAHVHLLQLFVRYYRGDLAGVEKHFAAGLQFFNDPVFRPRGASIAVFAHAAYCAWLAGRVNVARDRITSAAATVNPTNPYQRSFADQAAACLHTLIGENEEAEIVAARALELSEKHQITSVAAHSRCLLGLARAQLGHPAEGIELIRRGITEVPPVALGHDTTRLAVAQQRAVALDDALETAEKALEVTPEVLYYRPATLRVRGELRLAKGQTELAEADFRGSINLAKSLGAKAYELRTAMSWARLLASQDRADEARAMLAEIYNLFTEGFDTPDLKEAKALLEELAAGHSSSIRERQASTT
jgi:class 3 adenylate cyclase/tetratricopeptide (TPR) repeat protein